MGTAYVELHCHSNFSFLNGASHPEQLAERAGALGYPACALTDHHGLYGIVRFCQAALRHGVRPLVGAEITLTGGHHLVLLVRDARGYAQLCRLLSTAHLKSAKGAAQVDPSDLAQHTQGLLALSGCMRGEVPSLLQSGRHREAAAAAARYVEWFGREHFFLELQHHNLPLHATVCAELHRLGRQLGIPCVATNNVHYAQPRGRVLQDVLTCIRHHVTLDTAGDRLYPNAERYLKSAAAMEQRFARYPGAVENTLRVADTCRFSLSGLPAALPDFAGPDGMSSQAYLRRLTYEGARERYGTPGPDERAQIEHELRVIARLRLAGYFLIVWDIARFCREQGILCQGRGSAANSVVCYCLGITAVDPVKLRLLFERFISENRREPPDIDVDIANNRREEVIQYVYRRYGREHAAMVCEVITYRGRSAVREVGKVLGFAPSQIDRLARELGHYSDGKDVAERIRGTGLAPESPRVQRLIELCRDIRGFPRHLGIHVGGMIITARPLSELVPIENASMPDRSVIQWDKDDAQDVGLIKIDLLGLGMLSLIDEALQLVRRHHGVHVDPARLTYDDPKVYDLLCRAETVGVFQVESRAQMNTLPRMKPRCFYDLVVEVALIRPGPIQGGMVHPYLRRRDGAEPVTYPHPSLEPVLERTLGVPLFQEQGMRVAVTAAGFSPGQADLLRRAMGHKRSQEKMQAIRMALIDGMVKNGIARDAAFKIFDQLAAFADFGFAESHAASFALLVYVSAYLKVYYPAEFYCALLNAQPMGFYSPSSVVYEARRRGVRILGIDLLQSAWDCTVEDGAVRLGFKYVKKLGPEAKGRLEQARAAKPFGSLEDFVFRTRLDRDALEQVALVGTFRSLGLTRRQALWKVLALAHRRADELPLRVADRGAEQLPPMLTPDALLADFQGLNVSTGPHPMALLRARLKKRGVLSAADLQQTHHRQRVRTAGIVVIRQRPVTAKGFLFLTLEDETGFINVVVKPQQMERFRREVVYVSTLLVTGQVECAQGVVNVVGEQFESLGSDSDSVGLRSRDFR